MSKYNLVGYDNLRQEIVGGSEVWVADLITEGEEGALTATPYRITDDEGCPAEDGLLTASLAGEEIELEEITASRRSELMKQRRLMKRRMRRLKRRKPKNKKYLGYKVVKAMSEEGGMAKGPRGERYVALIIAKMPDGKLMVQKQHIHKPSSVVTRKVGAGKKRTIRVKKISPSQYDKLLRGGQQEEQPARQQKAASAEGAEEVVAEDGKATVNGKQGVWRTVGPGKHAIFYPDDGSDPIGTPAALAENSKKGPKRKKASPRRRAS